MGHGIAHFTPTHPLIPSDAPHWDPIHYHAPYPFPQMTMTTASPTPRSTIKQFRLFPCVFFSLPLTQEDRPSSRVVRAVRYPHPVCTPFNLFAFYVLFALVFPSSTFEGSAGRVVELRPRGGVLSGAESQLRLKVSCVATLCVSAQGAQGKACAHIMFCISFCQLEIRQPELTSTTDVLCAEPLKRLRMLYSEVLG